MKKLNLIGQKFNRLLVVGVSNNQYNKTSWKCLCDCGNYVNVITSNLRCNRVKSCGCLKNDKLIERSTTHNQRHTNLYEVWKTMKQRCVNPNNKSYKNYGGRGICVCDEWKNSFINFYNWSIENGYKKGLTIDRINVNDNYYPANCRWVNRIIQANNTRSNRYITYKNETKTIAGWARFFDIKYSTIQRRLKCGWSFEDAISKPIKHYK